MARTLTRNDHHKTRRQRLVRVLVWVTMLLLAKVFVSIVWEYRRYFPADFASNFLSGRRYSFSGTYRQAFYAHIVSSPIALMLATFLMLSGGRVLSGSRDRFLRLHRWAGRVQFFLVLLVVVPSGMVMAKDAYAGLIAALGFVSLNIATAVCLIVAVGQARSRKFAAHRRWATRTFLLLASPLLLRILAGAAIVTGVESESTYQLNSWISWLIPLLIYETCFSKPKPPLNSDSGGTSAPGNNRYRLSLLVGLLPFMEQQAAWEQVSNGMNRKQREASFAPMGPAPWTRQFDAWQTEFPSFRCPSDPGIGLPSHGRTNYVACLGDGTHWLNTGATRWDDESSSWVDDRNEQIMASGRGMFVPRQITRFQDVLDGSANTIMAGEICTDLGDRDKRTSGSLLNAWSEIHDNPKLCRDQISELRPHFWSEANTAVAPAGIGSNNQRRGYRWADGAGLYTGMNTILPPNAEVCLAGGDAGIGVLPPSSRHQGGVHVLMGDGAVKFITDTIETGDSDSGTVFLHGTEQREPGSISPYGLWGALGTRASAETLDTEF